MGHFYIVRLNNYLIHLAHRSIDNWCYWSNHKVCIQSCWDVVFVIALFAMYHRKIMAEVNGLPSFINYFTVINLFYFLEELSVLSLLLSLMLNVW